MSSNIGRKIGAQRRRTIFINYVRQGRAPRQSRGGVGDGRISADLNKYWMDGLCANKNYVADRFTPGLVRQAQFSANGIHAKSWCGVLSSRMSGLGAFSTKIFAAHSQGALGPLTTVNHIASAFRQPSVATSALSFLSSLRTKLLDCGAIPQ
jgi:hypothetical protein